MPQGKRLIGLVWLSLLCPMGAFAMNLSYIHWDVSPFIYEGEHFAIGWYGTLWVLGLVGLLITLLITFRHDGVPQQYAFLTFMITLVLAIFFAHLFQGLFYEWYIGADGHCHNYYFEHPLRFLDITQGGFSGHGFVPAVVLTGWLMAKIMNCDMWYIADRSCIGMACLPVTVRLANFINNEICGIETTLPWGVMFGDELIPRHPTQLYELLVDLVAMILLWWLFLKKQGGQYKGLLFAVYLIIANTLRVLIEFIKLPQMPVEEGWMLNMGQWLSVATAIFGLWLCFYAVGKGTTTKAVVTTVKKKKQNKQ